MRRKVFTAIAGVSCTTLLVVYLATFAFVYYTNRDVVITSLREEAQVIAQALPDVDAHEENPLEGYYSPTGSRLTLIDSDGNVLFDSQANASTMANHNNRPEVIEARQHGSGYTVRPSETLRQDTVYATHLLDGDDVLRISRPVTSLYATTLAGLPLIAIVALATMAVAVIIARHLSQTIVSPLTDVDLDHPLDNVTYPEFLPLLERIDEQNRTAEATVAMRREFSSNVSHELKTPLTSIAGYAEIIRNGIARPEDIAEFSSRIHQESQRLLALIDDIMALSRLDEGKITSTFRPLDLYEVTMGVISRLTEYARDRGVALSFAGEHCPITGVEHLIDEMTTNLVENAIKYNRPAGSVPPGTVNIWTGLMRGTPTLIVEDTGVGIAEADVPRIFERFYRADKSHSKNDAEGTGLGLSIVKHVAALHQATIDVTSTLGVGTKMKVSFPVVDASVES